MHFHENKTPRGLVTCLPPTVVALSVAPRPGSGAYKDSAF